MGSYTGGRLGSIVSPGANCTGTCADISYTYNRAGMRLSEASSIDGDPANGTASFTYDAAGRLTAYDAPGSIDDQAYGWEEVPNRDSLTIGATTVTTSFDAADRPVSDSASGTYTHDDDGNLLTMPGRQLVWDSLGRLTQVKDGSGNVLSSYTYDALDRLRQVTSAGVTVRHRYVGITTQVAQTRNVTAGTTILHYGNSWEGVRLAEWITPTSGRRYFGTNGHGDLVWAAGNGGIVNSSRRFDPWGGQVGSSGTHTDFRFQGSWRDPATGLYWVITRWYAPTLGTFLSEDSLLGEPQNPRSRHLRVYGGGDPVGMWDPDGRQVVEEREIAGCAAAMRRWGATLGLWACANAARLAAWALVRTRQMNADARWDGRRDALRHCVWAGWMSCFLGRAEARHFLKFHERGERSVTPRERLRKRMDRRNNNRGVRIGNRYRDRYLALSVLGVLVRQDFEPQFRREIEGACQWQLYSGGLVWIEEDPWRPPRYIQLVTSRKTVILIPYGRWV